MEETTEQSAARKIEGSGKPRRTTDMRRLGSLLFAIAIIIAAVGIAGIVVHARHDAAAKQALKAEAADAKVLSDRIVKAMAAQNTAQIVSLGDKDFQTKNTADDLNAKLTFQTTPPITFAQMYGDSTPTVDQQLVVNNSRGQHVTFVYKYNKLKAPFFVRLDATRASTKAKWQLQALAASVDEAKLLGVTNN